MSTPTLTAGPGARYESAEPTQAEEAARYAAVLATLLKENPKLPLLIWSVYPSGLIGRAVGRDDQDVTRQIQAWAQAFKVRAEVASTPQNVARHRPGYDDAWVLEPGEIKAFIAAFGGTIVGELLEVKPGGGR